MFRRGDVVRLKSGGLRMTVADCTEAGVFGKWAGYVSVKCMWHDEDGDPQETDYSADMLERVEGTVTT